MLPGPPSPRIPHAPDGAVRVVKSRRGLVLENVSSKATSTRRRSRPRSNRESWRAEHRLSKRSRDVDVCSVVRMVSAGEFPGMSCPAPLSKGKAERLAQEVRPREEDYRRLQSVPRERGRDS